MSMVDNLRAVRAAIARSAQTEVELIAVSKTWPPAAVAELAEAGQRVFGESRVQEAMEKIPLLPSGLDWHLIGHLQTNKARRALGLFSTIHSVDSLDLALALNRLAGEMGLFPKVYLQANVAGEARKHGFAPQVLRQALPRILELERLEVLGLMTIPPHAEDPEASRPWFRALRELRDELSDASGVPLNGLSMGMSHDYLVAVDEGATAVRVGSAIFGDRSP